MGKKKILITAGGTATAWHMVQTIKEYYSDKVEIHVCDINPPELIAASKEADFFYQVPMIVEDNYKNHMYNLLKDNKIDYIIPLIDWDLRIFSKDDKNLIEMKVFSTAPDKETTMILADKNRMEQFLKLKGIPTPSLIKKESEIKDEEKYILKPKVGCGSKGIKILYGKDLKANHSFNNESVIIQELCDGKEEITAEVFNSQGKVKVFCRSRVETKEGVCTKMLPRNIPEIDNIIKILVESIPMPTAFCVQFMQKEGKWNIIDCNLRIGAGTALSTAAGFQLTRAFFADLLNEQVTDDFFVVDSRIKAVVRVYQEEVML